MFHPIIENKEEHVFFSRVREMKQSFDIKKQKNLKDFAILRVPLCDVILPFKILSVVVPNAVNSVGRGRLRAFFVLSRYHAEYIYIYICIKKKDRFVHFLNSHHIYLLSLDAFPFLQHPDPQLPELELLDLAARRLGVVVDPEHVLGHCTPVIPSVFLLLLLLLGTLNSPR